VCTLTWSPRPGGYLLAFNRDERRTRLPALAPSRVAANADGLAYLAPSDADAGGTWLTANSAGLTVGVLNLYQAEVALIADHRPAQPRSRGLLVRELAGHADGDGVASALGRRELTSYLPFTLFAVDAAGDLRCWQWDGAGLLELLAPQPPLVSSGVDVAGATAARGALWREMAIEPQPGDLDAFRQLHLGFHASHRPQRGRLSPCMHREDASTVSLTLVEVDAERVAMRYAAGPPCTAPLGPRLELAREPAR
jgi:hypothetical protein